MIANKQSKEAIRRISSLIEMFKMTGSLKHDRYLYRRIHRPSYPLSHVSSNI